MKRIKFCALLVSAALVLSLLPAPAAAAGDFADISDESTAGNVAVLQLMGVIDGYSDGQFHPSDSLTRCQFCKMAVVLMGQEAAAAQYRTFTIFPDVRATHWAAGYVNLATRGTVKLISGYPDGTFRPQEAVTYGQAVTILMRLLGYTDSDVGAVWPDGYLSAAKSCGLTDGLSLTGSVVLTRAQAVQLFVNLLRTDGKGGSTPYGETLASSVERDAILLDADADADDGTPHAVQTSEGTYQTGEHRASALLEGMKGTLLLDDEGKVLTFVPAGGGSSKTITVASAQADCLLDAAGKEYPLAADTTVYDGGEKSTFGETFKTIPAGRTATIYYTASGAADYLFLSGTKSDAAVVVGADGSTLGLAALAGTDSFPIYKNGIPAAASDLRKYDVAVYDSAARAIRVSDTKLTGCYEDVYPNREAPTRLTMLGVELDVLPSAASALSGFRLGDSVTLLLTPDNQVAGAVQPTDTSSNEVGVVTEASASAASVELFCGLTVSGDPNLSDSEAGKYLGQLVRVSAPRAGEISLVRFSSSAGSASLNVSERTLGSAQLADNVRIFEKAGASKTTAISLGDLTGTKVPASQITYVRRDWAGRVDLLVLDDATGDRYTYGLIRVTSSEEEDSSASYVTVTNGDGQSGPYSTLSGYQDLVYGGVVPTADGSKVAKLVTLTKLGKVTAENWSGNETVTVNGVIYPVADHVQCYNASADKWISLSAARAFSASAEIYGDKDPDEGGKIRLIIITQ